MDLPTHLPIHLLPASQHQIYNTLLTTPLTTTDLLTLPALTISRHTPAHSLLDLRAFLNLLPTLLLPPTPGPTTPANHYAANNPTPLPSLPPIPPGKIIDLTGLSSSGKTQLCLALTAAYATAGTTTCWISTEGSGLPTPRLAQMHVDLDKVFTISCNDLETQLHVMKYQLPVLVTRYNVGLIILDSVTGNFRDGATSAAESRGKGLARRGGELVRMLTGWRDLCAREGVVGVAVNQVSETFKKDGKGAGRWGLDEQVRWFGGWEGGERGPALGLVWAGGLAGRWVVKREGEEEGGGRGGGGARRVVKVVWSDWGGEGEVVFVVEEGGVREVGGEEDGAGGGGWALEGEVEEE